MGRKRVLIVGDGPTGLSAALMLAKNDFEVEVFGDDDTAVRKARLHNLLAMDGAEGPDFVERGRRHAERFGAKLHKVRVTSVALDEPLRVDTEDGQHAGDYLVLATGWDGKLVKALELDKNEDGDLRADKDGRTSHDRVYAGGAAARGAKSHVATSIGDGAAIATDIMSREAGKPVHDYDVMKG